MISNSKRNQRTLSVTILIFWSTAMSQQDLFLVENKMKGAGTSEASGQTKEKL